MTNTITAGSQFQKNEAHAWTDTDGRKHWHSVVTLCEIVNVDASSIGYAVREVLEESGRPTDAGMIAAASKGTISMSGLAAAIKRGSIVPLASNHVVGSRR